jgi:hypothetical protein
MGQPEVEPAHDVGGIGRAGQERMPDHRRLPEAFGQAGRDDEFRARVDRALEVRRVGDGARAHDGAFDRLHRGDRLQRGGGAQGHFENTQAALDERAGHRKGMGHIIDHQHGNDRRGAHDGFDRLHELSP